MAKKVAGGMEDDNDGLDMGESLFRLGRDLKRASHGMTRRDARFLVDFYYMIQDERIRAASQVRTSKEDAEPHALLAWVFESMERFENGIRAALGEYAKTYSVGKWLQSICGIGPVLSAAILTNFDIRKAQTAAHFYRYAGMDPTCKWPSAVDAGKAVDEAVEKVKATTYDAIAVLNQFYQGQFTTNVDDIQAANALLAKHGAAVVRAVIPTWVRYRNGKGMKGSLAVSAQHFDDAVAFFNSLCEERGLSSPEASENIPFDAIRSVCDLFGRNVFNLLKLAESSSPNRSQLAKALSRRPYNARLKSICCYKVGESFVKTSGNDKSFYGKLYKMKKQELAAQNERGEFASVAAGEIASKPKMKGTQRYGHWENGKIAPAHVHDRARRWTVSLFISHVHHVMHVDYYGANPPVPFVFTKPELGDHRHFIDPPTYEGFEGRSLKEMFQGDPMDYKPMLKKLRSDEGSREHE